MNRTVAILGVVLLVQVILSIALFSLGNGSQAFATDEKLIVLALDQVDRIRIEDGDKQAVSITKKGDRWILPDLYGRSFAPQPRATRYRPALHRPVWAGAAMSPAASGQKGG